MAEVNKFQIVKLKDIISDNDLNGYYMPRILNFSCLNNDVEMFLKNKAASYECRGKSCTYLVVDSLNGEILAYYTLSLKSIDFDESVSKSVIKSIDGFSKDVSSIAVILIGQLGKNSIYKNKIIGKELLSLALGTVYSAKDILGGRICLLETEDTECNEKVVDFYRDNGFKILQHDKTDRFIQMFRKL